MRKFVIYYIPHNIKEKNICILNNNKKGDAKFSEKQI
jgi:hypothetical protein